MLLLWGVLLSDVVERESGKISVYLVASLARVLMIIIIQVVLRVIFKFMNVWLTIFVVNSCLSRQEVS